MKQFLILLALSSSIVAVAATTLHSASGWGGTLNAPTTKGLNITVSNVTLFSGGTANLYCPVTFFGAGTYQWNWTCAGGKLTIRGAIVASVSGTMKLTCSGGGRYGRTICVHSFTGTAIAKGSSGPISVLAKGGPNNTPGTVTSFSATW
jgi:hypothetical protein